MPTIKINIEIAKSAASLIPCFFIFSTFALIFIKETFSQEYLNFLFYLIIDDFKNFKFLKKFYNSLLSRNYKVWKEKGNFGALSVIFYPVLLITYITSRSSLPP